MTTFILKVDKLIRDKIPENLAKEKIFVSSRTMEKDEWIARLKDKLIEEAKEVAEAKTPQEFKEELADVLEVLSTLMGACHIEEGQIEQLREAKRLCKGGFEKKIYSSHLEIPTHHPKLSYYQERADRYPPLNKAP